MATDKTLQLLEEYKRILKMDNIVTECVNYIAISCYKLDGNTEKPISEAIKGISILGSSAEGCILPRFFLPNKEFKDGINAELEFDIDLKIHDARIEEREFYEDIPEKQGFVQVRATEPLFIAKLIDILEKISKHISQFQKCDINLTPAHVIDNGLLNGDKIKEIMVKAAAGRVIVRDITKLVNKLLSNGESESITASNPEENKQLTTASLESRIQLKSMEGEPVCNISWDMALVIKLHWWPQIADEWIKRERKWPNQDVISKLASSCHLIVKPSGKTESKEFRYTFAQAEKELSSLQSDEQKLVYFIFKSMIYKWIKPIDPDNISSYLGKTIMLWAVEENGKAYHIWNDSTNATIFLFERLLVAFEENKLPNYFIKTMNIMDKNLSQQVRDQVIETMTSIIKNVDSYIPDNVEDICNKLYAIGEKAKSLDLLPLDLIPLDLMPKINKEETKVFIKKVVHQVAKLANLEKAPAPGPPLD